MSEDKDKTILVVDNTKGNLDMVIAIFQDYDVIPCTTEADALEMVRKKQINLILLDMLMPEIDENSVCTKLKQNPATREIPIIFMTSKTDEDSIEKVYELGDIVLKKVANVIKEVLPPDAVFGRMGGEEFSVMYTAQTHELSIDIVSDILKTVSRTQIPLKDGGAVSCTISIGIGRKHPEFNALDNLLKEADMTLYEAKERGRNTSIFRDR